METIYYLLGMLVFWLLATMLWLLLLVIGWEFVRRRFPGLGRTWDANACLFSPRSRIFRDDMNCSPTEYWEVPRYIWLLWYEEGDRLVRYRWGITRRRRLRALSEAVTKAYFTKEKL